MMSRPAAFLYRDFRMELSYRAAFFMRFAGIFLAVATFYFVSLAFGETASPYLADYGGNYFAFALVGIAFGGFQSTGLGTFSSSISRAQSQGTLEAILVTPTRLTTMLASSATWEFIMTTLNVSIYLAIAVLAFGADFSNTNFLAGLLILLLTVLVFSGLGVLSASFIIVLKRGDPIAWAFGSVSAFMSGTLFPVTVLPDWLQALSRLFPLFYALEAMRAVLINGASLYEVRWEVVALAFFAVLILPLSVLAFRRAVRIAKEDGTLTAY